MEKKKRIKTLSQKDIKDVRKIIADCRDVNDKLIHFNSVHCKLYDFIELLLIDYERMREIVRLVKLKNVE